MQTIPHEEEDANANLSYPLDSPEAEESSTSADDMDLEQYTSTSPKSQVPELLYPTDPMYSPMYVNPAVFLPSSPSNGDLGLPYTDSHSFDINECTQRSECNSWDMYTIKMEVPDDTVPSYDIAQNYETHQLYTGSHTYESFEYQVFNEHHPEQAYSSTDYPV